MVFVLIGRQKLYGVLNIKVGIKLINFYFSDWTPIIIINYYYLFKY